MGKRITAKGQAAVEFSLSAPILLLFFFCLIQAAYTAYVSLAVQRAALAVARKSALSPLESSTAFKTQLALSLLPIVRLNPQTLPSILQAEYHSSLSSDQKKITATIRYPMPIWIPVVREIFGEPLSTAPPESQSPESHILKNIISLLNWPELNKPLQSASFPVRWVVFEETTFNESYRAGP